MFTKLSDHIKKHTLPYFCEQCFKVLFFCCFIIFYKFNSELFSFKRDFPAVEGWRPINVIFNKGKYWNVNSAIKYKQDDTFSFYFYLTRMYTWFQTFNSKKCLNYHKTTHDSDGDTSASEDENQILDSTSSCSKRQKLLASGATGFTDCFIWVKRADFIEAAVEEGFKSIRITRLGRNSTLNTPIPWFPQSQSH